MKIAAPSATRVLVLRPARRWRHCRSTPIAAPRQPATKMFNPAWARSVVTGGTPGERNDATLTKPGAFVPNRGRIHVEFRRKGIICPRLENLEDTMAWRILSGGAIAALAGAAMLAASSDPSPAFTLESPSLETPVAAAGI